VRFDGGPAMVELEKLESATGLSILYTLKVWGRFDRFATRVLGPDASPAERDKLKKELSAVWDNVLRQKNILEKTVADKGQKSTEEGYGRLERSTGSVIRFSTPTWHWAVSQDLKRTCTPRMRPSVSRRHGPCPGSNGRNTMPRSNNP
jgi:hypothetical protein